ncbi:MAG: site-specific integrase [Clostridia bacterium]|nr:site-specific integrase [Clostridia bacterium]
MNEIWSKRMTHQGYEYTLRFHYGRNEKGAYRWKKITAKTKAEARKKREEFELSVGTASTSIIQKQSLFSYLKNWGELYYKNSVREQTYVGFLNMLDSRLKPYFIAGVPIGSVSVDLLQNYIAELISAGYSRDTICKTWRFIRKCLRYGMEKSEISELKFNLVKLPNEDSVKTKTKTVSSFCLGDIEKIKEEACCKSIGGKQKYFYGDVIIFLMYTGLRIGEALALTWADVDLSGSTIYVNKTSVSLQDKSENAAKRTKEIIGSPKTKNSIRQVVLNTTAKNVLLSLRSKNIGHVDNDDRVFLSSKFTTPSRRNINRCLLAITKNANTNLQTGSVHILRHTYATMFLQKNVSISFISKQLGHAKETTTRNIYISYLDEAFDADKERFIGF